MRIKPAFDAMRQPKNPIILPDSERMRDHVIYALSRYWPADSRLIYSLPLTVLEPHPEMNLPLQLQSVQLPDWAASCSVDGCLLVPYESVPHASLNRDLGWQQIDWILAAFLMLEGWHERLWEHEHGPIHSYSLCLSGWDQRAWQYAWVNRIGLFLRQWAIHRDGPAAEVQLGTLPAAEIRITHDVDALRKTLPIRLKQGAFNLFNAARALCQGQFAKAGKRLCQANCFFFGRENWFVFDRLIALEHQARIQAIYHFYVDPRPKTFKRWLFDPSYSIEELAQSGLLQQLSYEGHHIGLHPGFDTWHRADQIEAARDQLQQAAGCTVAHVRQHWLRFSWRETWNAQASAGLKQDTTLMFNDRPGYRTSCALAWQPWNQTASTAHTLTALPTVLMDSHCYDYQPMTAYQRQQSIHQWIGECHAVHGQVAVLWHPHTLTKDYGWTQGFTDTIANFMENQV